MLGVASVYKAQMHHARHARVPQIFFPALEVSAGLLSVISDSIEAWSQCNTNTSISITTVGFAMSFLDLQSKRYKQVGTHF